MFLLDVNMSKKVCRDFEIKKKPQENQEIRSSFW